MYWRYFFLAVLAAAVHFSWNSRPRGFSLPRAAAEFEAVASAGEFIAPPGIFLRLSHGWTHYTIDHPAAGADSLDTVVLVHGLHDSVTHWTVMKRSLLDAGFSVITYDNYGNGWSDAPNAIYTESLYVSQLVELLFALNITKPVHLVGQSLGGAISSAFSSVHPSRVKSLTTLSPAGVSVKTPFLAKLANLPVISDILHAFVTESILLQRIEAGFSDPKYKAAKEYVLKMMKYQATYNKDLLRVLTRILTEFPLHDMRHVYTNVGRQTFPVHIVWGGKDLTSPIEGAHLLKEMIPRAESTLFPELGHTTYLQDPVRVNEAIVKNLKRFSLS